MILECKECGYIFLQSKLDRFKNDLDGGESINDSHFEYIPGVCSECGSVDCLSIPENEHPDYGHDNDEWNEADEVLEQIRLDRERERERLEEYS